MEIQSHKPLSLYSFECPEKLNANYLDFNLHLNIVFCIYESNNAKENDQQNLVPCSSDLAY